MARKLSEINAGSMADIAFLLLIFFIITTTMDKEYVKPRRLPPPIENNEDIPPMKDRNVFVVLVNKNDKLLVENKLIDISELLDMTKEFIDNPRNKVDLPEKMFITKSLINQNLSNLKVITDEKKRLSEEKKWKDRLEAHEVIGDFWESKQVINLQHDRGTTYNTYIQVQDILESAYNQLRNEYAIAKWGVEFNDLAEDKRMAVKTVYKQVITEAEPKNIGGN